MTQSLKDNPFTTRGGQGAALTAGGGAQLFQKGVMLAPKLVAPAVASRLSGPGVGSQLARYSGRLAALMGLGAADYYAYNAIAEAPNQARETGAPSPTMGQRIDYANSQAFTPAGLVASAIPGAGSLVARPVRAALAGGKNLVQTGLNKVLPNAVPAPRPGVTLSTMLTPADVQKRVAGFAGSLTTMSRTDAEKAIDMLLKRDFDPDEAEKMVRFLDYAGKSEVPETLFQLMPNLRRVDQLTVALGTVGGDAKEALAKVLGAQAQESPAILRNALRKAMGASGEDFYAMQKGIQADQLSAPKEGYAAAYAKEVSDDTWETQILPQLRTKYGREAVADAADYAEGLAGTDPAKLGVARQLAELRDALSSQGATPGKVSTQSLDYIDRMLGDVAEGLKSGSGRREIAKGPKGVQQGIRGDANSGLDVETGLADPRRLSFELKSAEEALTFGRKAFKDGTDIETLLDEFAYEMSKAGKGGADSETVRGALLMGWLRGAEDEISKATNPQSVIRRLYGSERQREKLLAMMPELADDAGAGAKSSNTKDIRALVGGKRDDGREMAGMIDRLKRISGDYNRIIGNSQSAQRAAAVLEESGTGDRINRLFDAVLAPKRAAVDIAKAGINMATKPGIYQPGVNRELGRLLTARGKAQLLSVIDEIRQRAIATSKYKPPGGATPPAPRTPPAGGSPAGPIRAGGFAGFPTGRLNKRPRSTPESMADHDEKLTNLFGGNPPPPRTPRDVEIERLAQVERDALTQLDDLNNRVVDMGVDPAILQERRILPSDVSPNAWPQVQEIMAQMDDAASRMMRARDGMASLRNAPEGDMFGRGGSREAPANALSGPDGPIRAGGFAGIERPRVAQRQTRSETFFDERLTPQENKAVEMRRNGFTVQEIADELDTSEGAVKKAISVAKAKGADIGDLARDTQTADILALKAKQLSNSQIAQRTGISPDVIKVTLSKERRRLRDAGQNLPNWLSARSAGISIPAGLRGDLANLGIGGAAGYAGDVNRDGKKDWKDAVIGAGALALAGRIPVRSAVNALDTAPGGLGGGGRGPRKPKADSPEAIKASVQKIVQKQKANSQTGMKIEKPEGRLSKGLSKLSGVMDDPVKAEAQAAAMHHAGRSADEIWDATKNIVVKIDGRTLLKRGPYPTQEENISAFWQAMALPASKRPDWVRRGTKEIFPKGPDVIAQKPFKDRAEYAAKRFSGSAADDASIVDREILWEETGVVAILKSKNGQPMMMTKASAVGSKAVAMLDGKQFRSWKEAMDWLKSVAALPRNKQPKWYTDNFSEVLDAKTLRKPTSLEIAPTKARELIRKHPIASRGVALAAGGTLGATGVALIANSTDRRQAKNALAK